MRAKFSALEQTYEIRLIAKFRPDRFILSPSVGKKKFLPFFGLRHLVLSPFGNSLNLEAPVVDMVNVTKFVGL